MATAIFLHFRLHRHRQFLLQNATSSLRSYSSSSSNSDENNNNKSQSYFSDVKSSLKNTPPSPQPRRPSLFNSNPSSREDSIKKVASIEDIRNNLSKFRREPSAQPPQSAAKAISFQELYQRNLTQKFDTGSGSVLNTGPDDLRTIRESLKSITSNLTQSQPEVTRSSRLSDIGLNLNLKLRPKSLNEMNLDVKNNTGNVSSESKTEFVRTFSHGELGEKLRKLRPSSKNVKFSLSELNERLQKVQEMDEKEMSNSTFRVIRDSLHKLNNSEQKKKAAPKTMLMLDDTSRDLSSPPKEALVEKYFHPDHMSSAEKQKLELKSVRDKFKTSESDCGSARVQVAQLTTKIKHLATVLHKKDKHSKKGLQAMVQRRKKLLKYLRRTDWDSYCFCLSELGLRDSPDYKA